MKNYMKIFLFMARTLIDPKPLRIRFDQISGFISIYYGTR